MSVYRRKDSKVWWVSYTTPSGKRIRESAGTNVKRQAQEYHDIRKSESWRENKLDETPKRTWEEIVTKYVKEKNNKKLIVSMKHDLEFLEPYFKGKFPDEITKDLIKEAVLARRDSTYTRKEGGKEYPVKSKTVNSMITMINAVFNHAYKDEWLTKPINIKPLPIPKDEIPRMRWLTQDEFHRLIVELPSHLVAPVTFAVSTGLRESNITLLEWHQIDLKQRIAWIPKHQSKACKDIEVPLNDDAFKVLSDQKGKHPVRVFTYNGRPFRRINGLGFKKALDRAKLAPVQRDEVVFKKLCHSININARALRSDLCLNHLILKKP